MITIRMFEELLKQEHFSLCLDHSHNMDDYLHWDMVLSSHTTTTAITMAEIQKQPLCSHW